MKTILKPMKDKTADFNLVSIKDHIPHCKKHGALICVKSDNNESVWRCIRSIADEDCKAACVRIREG